MLQLSAALKAPVGEYFARLYFDTVCFEPKSFNMRRRSFRWSTY